MMHKMPLDEWLNVGIGVSTAPVFANGLLIDDDQPIEFLIGRREMQA